MAQPNLDVDASKVDFLDDTEQIILYFKALFDLSIVFDKKRRTDFIKDLKEHGWSQKNIIHFENKASLRTNYSSNAYVESQARVEGNGAFMNPTAHIM